jgi:hypothetical protein
VYSWSTAAPLGSSQLRSAVPAPVTTSKFGGGSDGTDWITTAARGAAGAACTGIGCPTAPAKTAIVAANVCLNHEKRRRRDRGD